MSEITEQLRHYPEMIAFIESEFHRPIEDVAAVGYAQDLTTWYERIDYAPYQRPVQIPINQRLTVKFVDGTEETAFLNNKRFSYVEVLPEEQEK